MHVNTNYIYIYTYIYKLYTGTYIYIYIWNKSTPIYLSIYLSIYYLSIYLYVCMYICMYIYVHALYLNTRCPSFYYYNVFMATAALATPICVLRCTSFHETIMAVTGKASCNVVLR